jgi:hypothetical protein
MTGATEIFLHAPVNARFKLDCQAGSFADCEASARWIGRSISCLSVRSFCGPRCSPIIMKMIAQAASPFFISQRLEPSD